MLYNNGLGVPQDNARALELFRAAAEAGDPLGAYKLGCYYAGQFGVIPSDPALALRYKTIAARAGYSLAQLEVAILHHQRGEHREAYGWFEAAARQGDAQSLYNLSFMSREGQGTERSLARTHAFFRLSQGASRGSVTARAQQQLDEIWAQLSPTERSEATHMAATWITGPTPLTALARSGLERAERVSRGNP
jgi:TPR repeat protein